MNAGVASVAKRSTSAEMPGNAGYMTNCSRGVAKILLHFAARCSAPILGLISTYGQNPAYAAENCGFRLISYFFDFPTARGGRDEGEGLGPSGLTPNLPQRQPPTLGETG